MVNPPPPQIEENALIEAGLIEAPLWTRKFQPK